MRPAAPQPAGKREAVKGDLYVWKGVEDYKNDILIKYQKMLNERGIKNTKDFVAQIILENGQLEPDRLGDYQCYNRKRGTLRGAHCSFGVGQINTWSSLGISAEEALRRNPEWATLEWQLTDLANRASSAVDEHGANKYAIIDHNCPSCADAKVDACYVAGKRLSRCYYQKVTDKYPLLTSL